MEKEHQKVEEMIMYVFSLTLLTTEQELASAMLG
jgi:hypothetical protein